MPTMLPDTLDELRSLEHDLEREWWWLNGALHAIAQLQAEGTNGHLTAHREMHAQARMVDRRRVQIAVRIAELDRRLDRDASCSIPTRAQPR